MWSHSAVFSIQNAFHVWCINFWVSVCSGLRSLRIVFTDLQYSTEIAHFSHTRVGNLIVATIYLQLIQNRYMFRSFTVLQCSHQHCVQPVAIDVEVVEYL